MSDAHDIIGTRQECWYAPCQVDKVNIMHEMYPEATDKQIRKVLK